MPCFLPCGKAGGLQIPRFRGVAGVLTLEPSDFCNERVYTVMVGIEEPSGKPRGTFCLTAVLRSDRKEFCLLLIRSLTPQQATGDALAIWFNSGSTLATARPKRKVHEIKGIEIC